MTVLEDQFFRIPDPEDAEYWERVIAAGAHNPEPQTVNGQPGYTWIDLTDPTYQTPPEPPVVEGILYAGRRHVISGPPESTKTLVAYLLLLSAMRSGAGVAILDFEMGTHAAVTLLLELGATADELAQIHYTEPDQPPTSHDIARLTMLGVQYVLIDAAAGAYNAGGLDDNDRKDAEEFAAKWIRPLWQNGVATIVIDHVVKNADNRGNWVIGSERKIGQCDVHLSLESLKPLTRGGSGTVKVNVKRDRPGHLARPTMTVIELVSSPDNHQISWDFRDPHPDDTAEGYFRPTTLMERVSNWLQENDGEWSGKAVEDAVTGKAQGIRDALNALRKEGFITGTRSGTRYQYQHIKPYRHRDDLVPSGMYYPSQSDDLVPTSSLLVPRPADDLVPRPPSLEGDEVGRASETPSIQDLADQYYDQLDTSE